MYSNIVVSCNHVLSSSLEDNLTSTAPATKAGFDGGSWVVSSFTERAFVRRQLKILLPTFCFPLSASDLLFQIFWWNVFTGMDWCWFGYQISAQKPFHGDLSLSGQKADVEIDRLICFENGPPFSLQSLPWSLRGLLTFSISAVFPMQCKHANIKWYLGNLLWSLNEVCNFDLGFKMKVSTMTRAETPVEVRGHWETTLKLYPRPHTLSGVHWDTCHSKTLFVEWHGLFHLLSSSCNLHYCMIV